MGKAKSMVVSGKYAGSNVWLTLVEVKGGQNVFIGPDTVENLWVLDSSEKIDPVSGYARSLLLGAMTGGSLGGFMLGYASGKSQMMYRLKIEWKDTSDRLIYSTLEVDRETLEAIQRKFQ